MFALEQLYLNDNQLTGAIPISWGAMRLIS